MGLPGIVSKDGLAFVDIFATGLFLMGAVVSVLRASFPDDSNAVFMMQLIGGVAAPVSVYGFTRAQEVGDLR